MITIVKPIPYLYKTAKYTILNNKRDLQEGKNFHVNK